MPLTTESEYVEENLHISGSLGIWVRPYDAATWDEVPTTVNQDDPTAALESAGFVLLGASAKDGSTFAKKAQRTKHYIHQVRVPVRITEDQIEATFTSKLHEFSEDVLQAAMGGGTWEDLGDGNSVYLPPGAGEVNYQTFVVDSVDNSKVTRLIIEKGIGGGDSDVALKPDELSAFGLTVDALATTNLPSGWKLIRPNADATS